MSNLHRCANNPAYKTFFVVGGYDEKEAEIRRLLVLGYTTPPDLSWQTCLFGSGIWSNMGTDCPCWEPA